MFYTLLVLPYKWKKNEIGNFNKLDLSGPENVASAKAKAMEKTDTYLNTDKALRHFRNALSHGRIDWSANGELVMKDRDASYGHSYTANYLMMGLGELAQNLNMAIQIYIQTVITGRQA